MTDEKNNEEDNEEKRTNNNYTYIDNRVKKFSKIFQNNTGQLLSFKTFENDLFVGYIVEVSGPVLVLRDSVGNTIACDIQCVKLFVIQGDEQKKKNKEEKLKKQLEDLQAKEEKVEEPKKEFKEKVKERRSKE